MGLVRGWYGGIRGAEYCLSESGETYEINDGNNKGFMPVLDNLQRIAIPKLIGGCPGRHSQELHIYLLMGSLYCRPVI
jgi:hypothetical protein